MTQKKHRISPEDIDIKGLQRRLTKEVRPDILERTKAHIGDGKNACGKCPPSCKPCSIVFPKATGLSPNCPCEIYLKKDVAHVVEYLLLNLKI